MSGSRWQSAWLLALTLMLGAASWTHAESVELFATRDNTLYEDASGTVSNGAGEILLVERIGSTGQPTAYLLRRAVIFFDLAGSDLIPPGATIESVELRLSLLRESIQDPSARIVTLHRLEADWGEGSSNAGPLPGGGVAAEAGDATWRHTFFPTSFWANPGGDVSATASATTLVSGTGFHTWTSSQMADDVQAWLANPSSNHGWLIKCPYRSNPDQLDRGGLDQAIPDGIGDACQCGDVDDNGIVDNVDVGLFRVFLTGPNGLPFSPEGRAKCTVSQNSSDCDILDLAVLRRALLWPPPRIADSCGADS